MFQVLKRAHGPWIGSRAASFARPCHRWPSIYHQVVRQRGNGDGLGFRCSEQSRKHRARGGWLQGAEWSPVHVQSNVASVGTPFIASRPSCHSVWDLKMLSLTDSSRVYPFLKHLRWLCSEHCTAILPSPSTFASRIQSNMSNNLDCCVPAISKGELVSFHLRKRNIIPWWSSH